MRTDKEKSSLPGYSLRLATNADYPAIAEVIRQGNPRRPVSAASLEAYAQRAREHPLGLHLREWVALENDQTIGYASAAQWPGPYHPARYHAELIVLPNQRRRGIGSALAATMQAHLLQREMQEITAGAYEDQPQSLRFLEQRGFQEISRSFDNVLRLSEASALKSFLPDDLRLLTLDDLIRELSPNFALEAFRRSRTI